MKKRHLSLLLIFILCGFTSLPQTRFFTSEDFRGKMRGFNASYTLNYADLKNKDLAGMKRQGANHVRIWIGIKRGSNGGYNTWCNYFSNAVPSPLPVIDSAARMCARLGLAMVLTVEVHPRQAAVDWWGSTIRKDSLRQFYRMLATKYKDRPGIIAFDLMNEPRRNTSRTLGWSESKVVTEYLNLSRAIYADIRAIDPKRVIVIEVLYNQMLGRPEMAMVADSTKSTYLRNVVYSPHGYNWSKITHQGILSTEVKKFPVPDPRSTYSKTDYFDRVDYWYMPRDFARKYNQALWFGEFSCINWAPKNDLGQWSNAAWIRAVTDWFEKYGFSYAYHAQGEYQGWDHRYPSSWYYDKANGVTFSGAKPSKLPPSSVKSESTPAAMELKAKFEKNQ